MYWKRSNDIKYKQWWISIHSFFNSQHLTLDLRTSSTKPTLPVLTDRSVECVVSYPAIRLFFFRESQRRAKKGEKDRIIASLRWDDHRVLRLAVVHVVYGIIKNFLAHSSSYSKEFLSHRCRKTGFEAVILHFNSFFFFSFLALALKCHQCLPDYSNIMNIARQGSNSSGMSFCANPSKTIDCSQDPLIGSVADSCYTTRVNINTSLPFGNMEVYVLNCSVMSLCGMLKNQTCQTLQSMFKGAPMFEIESCDVECCQGDLCNNPSSSSPAPSTLSSTDSPVSTGTKSSVKSSVPSAITLFGNLVLMALTVVNF